MFTGIVEELGRVESISAKKLIVSAKIAVEGTVLGDSIAVNGICLTVISIDGNKLSFETMPETLKLTNLGLLHSSDEVNLEKALAVGSRIGGHFVQGHVDGTGKIQAIQADGEATIITFSAPKEITHYIVKKGFIAIDGTSLTVIDCDASSFSVSLVGYTKKHTLLGHKRTGDTVNLEVDILAKYVEALSKGDKSKISLGMLAEHGFLT
ncbi:MAG: riboflavin synthase [Chloroflexi bacterium]|mgnify:CR=1 FL=1|jgi:riboflavin synthase|nr:riboflavin synthase [Chloroflexota bacterium]MBT7081445.1 riboflavin synthase [Chloroflexota bacterium]MBT7289830.1 riboflavin synthase [Chloroflexota bacterium]